MRPSGSTAAASGKINPAPPVAILPRWTKCQSLASPSCAEYWHIGETTTRFLRVMPRSAMGENKSGCDAIGILLAGRWWNDQNVGSRNLNLESMRDRVQIPGGIWLIRPLHQESGVECT